jgi:bile acid:Na+ symporter, BASS family
MVPLLVKLTLFSIMFALGLSLQLDALQQVRQRPALFLRVLVGSCFLVPLAALALLRLPPAFDLSVPGRLAIALMAISPSAPLTLRKAGKQGGDRELAALLQVGAAIVAIASIPLMADLFRTTYGVKSWDIGPAPVALQVAQAQLLPLVLGLLARRWQPALATRIQAPLEKLANLLLLALIVLVLVKAAPLLVPFAATNVLALACMALMVVVALAIGYLMAGPDPRERTTTALVTSMRNPGLALLFAATYAPQVPGVKIAILAYLLITVILSVPFLRWRKNAAVQVT